MILIPLKTINGLNVREHHMARARRVKRERQAVAWALSVESRPVLPCEVVLTRIAPSNGLDPGDNLNGALKAVRDQIAEWLGVDDKDDTRVRYVYAQKRGAWGVGIEFKEQS